MHFFVKFSDRHVRRLSQLVCLPATRAGVFRRIGEDRCPACLGIVGLALCVTRAIGLQVMRSAQATPSRTSLSRGMR